MLHNNPEEVRPHLHRSDSLKFRILFVVLRTNSRVVLWIWAIIKILSNYNPQCTSCWVKTKVIVDCVQKLIASTVSWPTQPTDLYTGCPRRNVPDFGRVFLMLKYTDITQNTYIQSWTVTEIMAREKCGLLAVPLTAPFQLTRYMYSAHVLQTGMQSTLCLRAHVKCLEPEGRLRR